MRVLALSLLLALSACKPDPDPHFPSQDTEAVAKARRWTERYLPGTPYMVTCDPNLLFGNCMRPCTVVLENPHRVVGLQCLSGGIAGDSCILTGSVE